MSLRKFRFDELARTEPGTVITLDRAEHNHLFKVLRARPGDKIGLLDGKGCSGEAVVSAGSVITLTAKQFCEKPARRIRLYLAPPRRQQTDMVLRQAVELGASGILPMLCEYSVSEPDAGSVLGRWTDVMFEACKQSGNPFLPETCAPMRFADAVKDAKEHCTRLFYGAVENAVSTEEYRHENGEFAWFIGPEGGFSASELEILKQNAIPLRIGRYILRVETAAAAGIALLTGDTF